MPDNFDTLANKQIVVYDQMKIFVDNWNKQKDKGESYVVTRLEGCGDLWNSFTRNHQCIRLVATEPDLEKAYFKDNSYAKAENFFYNTKGVMNEVLRTLAKAASAKQPVPTAKKSTECKLPRLETPKFNGNFLDWPSFSDLFVTSIHRNTELSNAQKLQYLKASLIDDASKILRTTKVTDDNYEPAWKMLEERYNNTGALVQAQIHALLNQQKATNISGIKSLHDTTLDCLQSLENLGIKTENWDTILVYLLHERTCGNKFDLGKKTFQHGMK